VQLTDDAAAAAQKRVGELQAQLQQQYSQTEPGLQLLLQPEASGGAAGKAPLAAAGVQQLLQLLTTLPHGPVKMSEAIPGGCFANCKSCVCSWTVPWVYIGLTQVATAKCFGCLCVFKVLCTDSAPAANPPPPPSHWPDIAAGLVETSTNLASVTPVTDTPGDTTFLVTTSTRSSLPSALEEVRQRIAAAAAAAGAAVDLQPAYAGWDPNPASPLLQLTKVAVAKVTGKDPEVRGAGKGAGLKNGLTAAVKGPALHGQMVTCRPQTPMRATLAADMCSTSMCCSLGSHIYLIHAPPATSFCRGQSSGQAPEWWPDCTTADAASATAAL
jgi:hypothetical protein